MLAVSVNLAQIMYNISSWEYFMLITAMSLDDAWKNSNDFVYAFKQS